MAREKGSKVTPTVQGIMKKVLRGEECIPTEDLKKTVFALNNGLRELEKTMDYNQKAMVMRIIQQNLESIEVVTSALPPKRKPKKDITDIKIGSWEVANL